jgi:general secretion pathway protein B
MSYILDALRKADAERERGHVPGIHAQPIFAGAPRAAAPASTRPWAWIGAATAMALLVGVLLWWVMRGGGETAAPPMPVAAAPVVAAPVAITPMPPAAVAPPVPPAVAPEPAAPVVARATPATPAPAPAPTPARSARPGPAAAAKPAPAASAADPIVAASPPKGASAPGAATDGRVYALNELPDEIRRQLPTLTIGGSMYSNTPADRILILNGQVLHEGDRIAPELVLQQIRLKAAVLSFKGYRYTITF